MRKKIELIIFVYFLSFSFLTIAADRQETEEGKLGVSFSALAAKRTVLMPQGVDLEKKTDFWRPITCCGFPGSGKSTTFRALQHIFRQVLPGQDQAIWINQDECGGDRRRFEAAVCGIEISRTILLADKGNHTRHHREQIAKLLAKISEHKPLLIEFSSEIPDGVLLQRIGHRGKGHRSIQSAGFARTVIEKWRREFDPINAADREDFQVIRIDSQAPLAVNLQIILMTYFEEHPDLQLRLKKKPGIIEEALAKSKKFEEELCAIVGNSAPMNGAKPHHRRTKSEALGSQSFGKQPKNTGGDKKEPRATAGPPAASGVFTPASALRGSQPRIKAVFKSKLKSEKDKTPVSKNPFSVLGTACHDGDEEED